MAIFDEIQHVVHTVGRAAVLPDWGELYDQARAPTLIFIHWPIIKRPHILVTVNDILRRAECTALFSQSGF
jgi:hypothetical protein